MRKILVITSSYPATGGSRTERFLKYLGDFCYEPVVLTTGRIRRNREWDRWNPSADHIRTYRAFSIKRTPFRILSRYFNLFETAAYLERFVFIPDLAVTWVPGAIIKGLRILKEESIDLIYSTSPPESTHIIGMVLSKLTGKKWIADFRDLWTQRRKVTYRPPTILHHNITTKLEKYFFLKADHIIANTEENGTVYLNSFPIGKEKITVITNGYDPEDLKAVTTQGGRNKDCLNIGYMGPFDKEYPWKEFIACLKMFIDVRPGAKVRVNVYGEPPSKNVIEFVRGNRLINYFRFHGEFSHSDAMKLTSQNDLLLLLLLETGYSRAQVPQKLYNYLIMDKQILAICPEHWATADIITTTNTGRFVSPTDSQGVLRLIEEYYNMWMAKGRIDNFPNMTEISKYDMRSLTRELSRVFDHLLKVQGDRVRLNN